MIKLSFTGSAHPDTAAPGKQRSLHLFAILLSFSCTHVAAAPPQVSLTEVQSHFGFPNPVWKEQRATFRSPYTTLCLEANSRKCMLNNVLIWMNGPLAKNGKGWQMAQADVLTILDPLLRTGPALANAGTQVIVLDPGHGGSDSGAISRRRVLEKKVVLDVAKRVRRALQGSGRTVKLTRERDTSVSLEARTALARRWKGDLFVSIHLNSAHNRDAAGIETYTLTAAGFPSTSPGRTEATRYTGNQNDARNTILAYYMHKGLLSQTKAFDRGLKHARFDVLRRVSCPAALVECGFLSNTREEAKMIDAAYRQKIADGITMGILTYLSRASSGS